MKAFPVPPILAFLGCDRKIWRNIFYTAPTAIRAFIEMGEDIPNARNLSSLRLLGTVGEPINPEAWIWYHRVIGGKMPDCRYLVANGNGRDYDYPFARGDRLPNLVPVPVLFLELLPRLSI